MGIGIQGNGGVVAEVDGTLYRALRMTGRGIDYGSLGYYQVSVATGTLAATLAANSQIFNWRWTDATRLAVLLFLQVDFEPLTPRTAATLTDFGFDAYVARSFSAVGSGGTALTLTGNSFKTRTAQGTSLVNDVRIATTGTLTAGTQTLDGNAFASSIGVPQRVNPTAATEEVNQPVPKLLWSPSPVNGETPLVFAQNEGFVVRNRVVWPAAGTGVANVMARWAEVNTY